MLTPPPWTTFCVFYSWESTDNNFHTSPDTKQQNKKKKHNFKFTLVHDGQEGQQMNSDIKRRKSYQGKRVLVREDSLIRKGGFYLKKKKNIQY